MELDDVIYKWIIDAVRNGKFHVDENGDVNPPRIDVYADPLLRDQLAIEFLEVFTKTVVDSYAGGNLGSRDKRVKTAVGNLLGRIHLSDPSKKEDQYALDHMFESMGHKLPDELFSDVAMWEDLKYPGTVKLAPLARKALKQDEERGRKLHTSLESAVRRLERTFKKRYKILVARAIFAYAVEGEAVRILDDVAKVLNANGIQLGQTQK